MANAVEAVIRSTISKGVGLIADFNRRRMARTGEVHPFLSGLHEPMREEKTLTALAVTGTIPAALDGRYLRMGPNPIAAEPAGYHWFLGDGMVHGIAIQGGEALWYRNRWIRSNAVGAALGEQPAPGPRHGHDTVNTNVVDIAGRTWALVEAGSYPVEMSDTLEDQRYNPFDDTLRGSFTAHPHQDPLTGEHHAIAYEATEADVVRHVVLNAAGTVVREEPITVRHGPSIHDCAFTARFAIILDLPVTFSMKALIGGHRFPYRWNPTHRARVGLLPRRGGNDDILWCDVEPCYVFHCFNAFDASDGGVILDVIAYDTMFADSHEGPDAAGRFERWTINPLSRSIARRVVDPSPQEFPRIDERRLGQPYRYAYAVGLPQESNVQLIGATRLIANDLQTGNRQVHEFGPGRHVGEFVFVPARPDAAENEGWLIGLVIDGRTEATDLVILNARAFADPPVATIHIPHRVPPGFHGNWLPHRP